MENLKIGENETLVELVLNNSELKDHPIIIYGGEEFKKYELRCTRSNGHQGFNNLYRLTLPCGTFCVSTKSCTDYNISKPNNVVYVHRLQEIEKENGELVYSISKTKKNSIVFKQGEGEEEMI